MNEAKYDSAYVLEGKWGRFLLARLTGIKIADTSKR